MKPVLPVLALSLLLASCAVGPDYKKAGVESALVDKEWHATLPHGGKMADLSTWWSQFDDPVMTSLLTDAETSSPTLDAALARVNQSRASLRVNNAALLPTVAGNASTTRARSAASGFAVEQTASIASLDAGWELDLFGGKRRAIEQSTAQLQSSEAGWHDARVTLAAEVADAYVSLRACESDVDLYTRRLKSQSDTRDLVNLKVNAGFASRSDGDLSEASAADAASTLENQKGVCAQRFNLLAQLTAVPAATLQQRLAAATGAVPSPRNADVTTVPADTIQQRPDIAAAERNLAAASAAIGVAEAERYPSLSLGGAIGINKANGSSSLSTWSFGPSLSLPLFNGGALKAEADRTRAVLDETVAAYRSAVRLAVNEVEDALARLDAVDRRTENAEQAVDRYRKYLAAMDSNYKAGVASLLDLEEARRTVYSSEETLITVRQEQAQAWIALYKAVGGGWNGQYDVPGEITSAVSLQTETK
ncbi:MAG: efflux transporter outer membrane subunit [Micavibrio sp.]|nr:efflux transporter outer membrane subunit [Micavibrio sp.]